MDPRPPLRGAFGKPFAYQVAAFRLRLAELRATLRWDDVWQAGHDRAFMVAGAAKADLLADLAAAVDRAISGGASLEDFRRDFRKIVADRGWSGWTGQGTKRGEAWRTRVIYRTNAATTYAAGRWAQLREAGYPLLVYRHGGSLEPRIIHLGWDGLILPAGHAFWATHAPPNGWGCKCYVLGADSEAGAVRLGGKPGKTLPDGWDRLLPKTGAPAGIDRGWAYAPGASVAEEIAAVVARAAARVPPRLAADLTASASRHVDAAWREWVGRALGRKESEAGFLGAFSKEVLEALVETDIRPVSAAVMVRPGIVAGPKAERHALAGDALSEAEWMDLAARFTQPRAVYRDNRSGNLILILDAAEEGTGRVIQIAVEVDAAMERLNEGGLTANLATSAYKPRLDAILARVRGGLLTLLMGGVG